MHDCCRNAAKLLQLDPLHENNILASVKGWHASLGALLAWHYCQLLTALPKRDSEASAWQQLAQSLTHQSTAGWLDAGDASLHWHGLALEEVFGGLQQMQGGQQAGRGLVVDLMTRRAYVRLG